jgi:peptidoglycan hydrolase-like protein with peptidoglycan-binding domain
MYPQSNLQPGQSGAEVTKLQQFLIQQGYSIPAGTTGYFGDQTKAALSQWQQDTGVQAGADLGYWGPKSIAAASGTVVSGGKSDPKQPLTDAEYEQAAATHPIVDAYVKAGSSLDDITNAVATGDFSNVKNAYGQPFTIEEQQAALAQGMKDNELYYSALKEKDTKDTEAALAQKQADYQDYLLNSGENFQTDKSALDQKSANQGVLFSGSRVQKEKKMASAYAADQASEQATYGRDIASTARDYQYKYGNEAASPLSSYYNLGSNVYNPKVATGGVSSGGLATVYNPSASNFQGTTVTKQKAEANKRAAGYLWNKGNKLVGGIKNQY